MGAGLIERVESGAERGASALFAAAVAYSVYALLAAAGLQPQFALGAAAAGTLAYLPCSRLLAIAGGRTPGFVLPDFQLPDFGFAEPLEELLLTERLAPEELLLNDRVAPDELLMTDADRVGPADQAPLVLDDIFAEIGPDARVVRLFDRKAMAAPALTPGQLQSRIADRLADGAPPVAPSHRPGLSNRSDDSQALSAALAELRRSLR
jgi:hypothetical protein